MIPAKIFEETLQGYEKANAKVETCQDSSGFIAFIDLIWLKPTKSNSKGQVNQGQSKCQHFVASVHRFGASVKLRRSFMNQCSSLRRAVEVIRHLSLLCELFRCLKMFETKSLLIFDNFGFAPNGFGYIQYVFHDPLNFLHVDLWEWCHSLNFHGISGHRWMFKLCSRPWPGLLPYFSGWLLSLCCLPVLAAKCGDFLPGTIVALDRPSLLCSKTGIRCDSAQPRCYIPKRQFLLHVFFVVSPTHEPFFMSVQFRNFLRNEPSWLVD